MHASRRDRRDHLTVRLYNRAARLDALHFYFSRKVCTLYSVVIASLTCVLDPLVQRLVHQENLEREAVQVSCFRISTHLLTTRY